MSASDPAGDLQPIRVATACFVVSRILMRPPDADLLDKLASPSLRTSWPVPRPGSTAALEAMGQALDLERARAGFRDLVAGSEGDSAPGSADADGTADAPARAGSEILGENFAHLAERTLALRGARDPSELVHEMRAFREQEVEPRARVVLAGCAAVDCPQPYASLPALVADILEEHEQLCREALDPGSQANR
ncbi:MAG: hypothetical protein L0L69_10840 [Propionibacterium sp.]|nr:hypothetical protein [Propionibacterium sp.]MDN6795528.1 hypothetical protein [Propionibacterium sp.]